MKRKYDWFMISFWILFSFVLSVFATWFIDRMLTPQAPAERAVFYLKTIPIAFIAINISCPIWVFFFKRKE